jgi:HK97 family phage portal protein
MWNPFRKTASPAARKSASFFLSPAAVRAGLSGATYNQLASDGYAECLVAFACINRIASAIAAVEPQLYRRTKGKLTKIEDHDLLTLLESPNPAQSGKEFMRYLVSYHQLAGNAFILGNGIDHKASKGKPPTGLQLLNPGLVKVEKGESFLPSYYEYKPTSDKTFRYDVDQVSGRSAVLHLKTFNPLNAFYGLSALNPAARSVDIHSGGQKWNLSLISNGARPSGAIIMNQPSAAGETNTAITDDQYERVKSMIDEQFSGASNAGRPMLLEGGLDWKEMSLNPKDMEFLEGKHSAARDIALVYGVPPQLLGIPGDSTFSNYSEAKIAFWTDTIIPLLCWYLEAFNRWLTPLYGEDLYLWYDEEMIPALEPLRKAKADRINTADYLTTDEKRAAMGYDSYVPTGKPGSTIFVSTAEIPLEMAGEIDLAEPGSPADQEVDDEEEPPVDD